MSPQLRYPVEVYQYGYGDRYPLNCSSKTIKSIFILTMFLSINHRWNGSYVLSKSPRHVLDVYRDQLSSLKPHQVSLLLYVLHSHGECLIIAILMYFFLQFIACSLYGNHIQKMFWPHFQIIVHLAVIFGCHACS